MKTPIFKPEDFQSYTIELNEYAAAELANAKLQKLVESAPMVYGNTVSPWLHGGATASDTHQARLLFIEPLEIKECEHKLIKYNGRYPAADGQRKACGARMVLTQKWEVVK